MSRAEEADEGSLYYEMTALARRTLTLSRPYLDGRGNTLMAVTVNGDSHPFEAAVPMALFDVHVALYVVSWALSVIFLMATAAQAFRSRELPVWLSVAAVLIALVNLAAVAGPTTPLASFPNLLMWLWTLATSITFLIRRPIAAVN